MKILRLILGDQLNPDHSWYEEKTDNHTYVIMEMEQELYYTTHHIQKVLAFFQAMRSFADHLQKQGHQVIYLSLDHSENTQNLESNLLHLVEKHRFTKFEYQLPDEWRLDQQLTEISEKLSIPVNSFTTEHFLTSRKLLKEFFEGKKQLLMESFYRMMRKRHRVLMHQGEPLGGKWNYDQENRKKLPNGHRIPPPKTFPKKVHSLIELLKAREIKTIGTVDPDNFGWPVNREEAWELFDHFLKKCLRLFGAYQDAMTEKSWALYHSRISFALNAKIISPEEVIRRTEKHWYRHQEVLPISTVEGFIRQILGWREYMRGIYWMHMPEYKSANFFDHQNKLPSWYWTGKTKMKCLSHAIGQSLEHAYAHHIQRLMVTGNFALLAGVDPDEVDQWYLGIYIDAIEWVEITNTRGMSQFADGGIVATKPYISSANYLHKMGHYCGSCAYNYKQKVGDGACPFNSLYWNFLDRHRIKLQKNPRMSMIYRVWDKNSPESQKQILAQATHYLEQIEKL